MNREAKILLVEDDQSLLNGIADLLEVADTGYRVEVLTASDGKQGLDILANATPDLIISDIMMPQIGGFELLKRLRQVPAWVHIPVIFLSARGTKQDVLEGRLRGAELYITKPFDNDELLELVRSQLDRAFELQAARQNDLRLQQRNIIDLLNHEFRTPLTYVTAYYEMLADSLQNSNVEDLREYLRGIRAGTLRLSELVEDFIEVLELRTGEGEARFSEQAGPIEDLDSFFRQICKEFDEIVSVRGIRLTCVIPERLPAVHGDRERIKDICGRLFDNAVKFVLAKRHSDPAIKFSVGTNDEELFISVQDNGIGMPGHVGEHAFDLFYQYNRQEMEQQGSGTGLTIVKGVVELHGGRVEVESEEGVGSTFMIYLPLLGTPTRPLPQIPEPGIPQQATVLVVEDEWYLLNGLRELLQLLESEYELNVLIASNGEEGLEVMTRHQPDLIISDIMMPRMDGYEFLDAVRQNPAWVQIPVIFLTAKGERRDIMKGRRSGVEEYITKPYESDELMDLVVTQLRRHFQRQEVISHTLDGLKRGILDLLQPNFQAPLSKVSEYSDRLERDLDDVKTEGDLRASLEGIRAGSKRVNELVEDFIFLAELQTGELAAAHELRAMPLDASVALREIVDGWRLATGQASARIERSLAPTLPLVRMNPERFARCVERLLETVQLSESGGARAKLFLEAEQVENTVVIAVGSANTGFSNESAARICTMLESQDPSLHELSSLDAGLAIAKGIVQVHGGELSLENRERLNCKFVVSLPIYDTVAQEN